MLCVVAAVHPSEQVVVQRLYADADAVHTKCPETLQIGEALFHYILRINLHGKLRVGTAVAALFKSQQDASKI